MKTLFQNALLLITLFVFVALAGCGRNRTPNVKPDVEKALDAAGMKTVKVYEDRDKGVITLRGTVVGQDEKDKAESIARTASGPDVVANEILVTEGDKSHARAVAIAKDDGIEAAFKLFLKEARIDDGKVHGRSIYGVLTLTGAVRSTAVRDDIEQHARKIDGVHQVINDLKITKKGATEGRTSKY